MSEPEAHELLKQVRKALTRRLHLESPQFELECAGRKVSGSVISPSFRGMRDSERQRRIWDALGDEYGAESFQRVGALLAFTPDEWDLDSDSGGAENGAIATKRSRRARRGRIGSG